LTRWDIRARSAIGFGLDVWGHDHYTHALKALGHQVIIVAFSVTGDAFDSRILTQRPLDTASAGYAHWNSTLPAKNLSGISRHQIWRVLGQHEIPPERRGLTLEV
jgi:hypothetical protein